jgi:hypothetical protein
VAFQGAYVEDAYLGLFLQLGVAGLLVFAAAIVLSGRRLGARLADAGPRERGLAAGFAGAVVAGLVLALTQSFVYSAGNVATLTFWVSLLCAAAALRQRSASTSRSSGAVSP